MTTVDAANIHNIAIEGTFDDCQDLLKALFADAKLHAPVSRQHCIAFRHDFLYLKASPCRRDDRWVFDQQAVADRLHDAAAMAKNHWIDGIPVCLQRRKSALLIGTHQSAVADHVGKDDCRQFTLRPIGPSAIGHGVSLAEAIGQE